MAPSTRGRSTSPDATADAVGAFPQDHPQVPRVVLRPTVEADDDAEGLDAEQAQIDREMSRPPIPRLPSNVVLPVVHRVKVLTPTLLYMM